ncbi:MAG: diguanylate cyclase response regulator [Cyanobacteria bacterium SW_12_48_29]|jgi:diguanylate cyclase (GGDEF)-like protein|nr:MAG: diguanylate cyclase response regulator [Cyanobacteria bacterium QS_1_48_34]PSO79756.1 MAG: diguanylate cyclase response regulator [Cyanobacteria bacterium QS_5_48_63]PSO85247.1 MAG: diguanylate cyclase response regulator [Cyanobacteria bacterium QS_3_48_167]PSO96951.1 MAG: diguanylate cyclase response regulator [Cyanobacteria bacterium QS_6_48_18]PSP04385.1 MAG: diguanylate cyclase response regulator [Cyanobacteria bacterium SW_12_48_29]PSP12061.1 MAG: diguanylate cyclase response regu
MNFEIRNNSPLILLVDPEKTQRLILRRAMEKEGYRVMEASDGEQCLEVCSYLKPDLVLLDAMMPGVDGFTCCSQLHSLMGKDCPPVLMTTVLNDQASVDLAFEVGAIDYVTKPVIWSLLRQRLYRLFQNQWAMGELQRLSLVDGLTKIANRRSFDERLPQEWHRLAREAAPLSLVLCDLDRFKNYNGLYGHQAGDECLQEVAKVLDESAKRPADLAARYGGEEFALILPNTDAEGAVRIAETIQGRLQASAIAHENSDVSKLVTLSMGVASEIPKPDSSEKALIEQADQALYRAKQQGGDRVVLPSSDS